MKKLFLLFLAVYSGVCYGQTSQAVFEKQIHELLKYSDKKFNEIKGEAIPGTSDEFMSTYNMTGAVKNVIWETFWIYFIATFPETEDSTEVSVAFAKMEESIKKVLGNKATTKTSEEEKALTSSIHVKIKTIQFRKHDGESTAYYVKLELKKTSRDGYQFADKVRRSDWTIIVTTYQDLEF